MTQGLHHASTARSYRPVVEARQLFDQGVTHLTLQR